MKKKIFILFFMFLLVINVCFGWGPNTHLHITKQALEESEDTLIKTIIEDNMDACYVGLIYPDVGIFYYYTNFKVYAGLHNYNTGNEILRLASNDRERAFAYCYKIHLAEDGVSHNYYVPSAIIKSKMPNYIIHPIVELKIEGKYLDPIANRMMENHKEFDKLVEKATGVDWSGEAEKLNLIIGGSSFYDEAYAHDSISWWGKLQNKFYDVLSLFISEKTSVEYYTLSVESAKEVFNGQTSSLDPSGEKALNDADSSANLWIYIITFVVAIVIFWVSIKYKVIWFGKK